MVAPKTGYYWQLASQRYKDFTAFGNTFLPGGKAPNTGSQITLPDHARSLELIARTKGEAFYRGELAEAIVADSNLHDGVMSLDDLSEHQCDWVGTLNQSLNDMDLHEIPPSGQGLMALIAVGIVEHLDLAQYELDSLDSVHYQIEATRIAYAEIERHLADIDHMIVTPDQLLDSEYLRQHASSINRESANPSPTTLGAGSDTVYLSTADESGMMVSMIQSNYNGFGSGIVIPETGISMQNRGSGFTLEPGHPNQVAGGKRPYHTIIPGFVCSNKTGEPIMSFGVMGGHMQAQGHLQMMVRIFLHNQNPQAASDAPRWHLREDGVVCLERGFDPTVVRGLIERGHDIKAENPEHIFGGAQLIYRLDDGYCAGSDHRKEGQAIGY